MHVVWSFLVVILEIASVTMRPITIFLILIQTVFFTSDEKRKTRLAGTAGRYFESGEIVRKKGGHAWLGMQGIAIDAFVNPSGNSLVKVLTEKTIMHWPLQHVEIIE